MINKEELIKILEENFDCRCLTENDDGELVAIDLTEIVAQKILALLSKQEEAIRAELLDKVEEQLEEYYQQFDSKWQKTEDDNNVAEKMYMISRSRWLGFRHSLKESNKDKDEEEHKQS